jgi:hypothetical protein
MGRRYASAADQSGHLVPAGHVPDTARVGFTACGIAMRQRASGPPPMWRKNEITCKGCLEVGKRAGRALLDQLKAGS